MVTFVHSLHCAPNGPMFAAIRLWFRGMIVLMSDDLHALKDDMTAFILGNGLSRFSAYVSEEMESVLWETGANADSWKDFVELAKTCGVKFLTFSDDILEKE